MTRPTGAALAKRLVSADKLRFDGLLDHVRAIVAGAEMFEPKDRRKIITKADKLWVELRSARKRQLYAAEAARH
jgi:hypothetical protein